MFTTRLISGIVLVALAVLVVGKGGGILFAVTGIISLIGLFELYRALGIHRRSIAAVGYLTAVSYYGILWWEGEKYLNLMIIASLMVLMALYVFTFPKYKTEEITGAFFGVCYVPVMLSFLYQTREMSDGAYLVWLIFLSSWGCDTCAYCVGMLIGKHKMAPRLSPRKSIEGAVGGAAGAAEARTGEAEAAEAWTGTAATREARTGETGARTGEAAVRETPDGAAETEGKLRAGECL